jgi:glycine oxidase
MSTGMRCTVLGAGLMGRLLALHLAQAGHRVILVDAGGPQADQSAARVAAAMLAPWAESAVAEAPIVRMGVHGLTRWPQILAKLAEPVFFQQSGTLVLWHRQDEPQARVFEGKVLHAVPDGAPPLQSLGRADIDALEPGLGHRFSKAFYFPQEGQLDNRQLLSALLARLQQLGVELRWHTRLELDDPGAATPEALGKPDWVFDCRGLGAAPGWDGLRGVRGEVVRLHAPHVGLQRPVRLLHPQYPLYIAPKPDGVFVIGATEIESEDFSPMSVRSALELLSAAYTVDKGFGEARILELSTQCRPALPDNQPAIRLMSWSGRPCMRINGLYRHGFLIAPAVLDAAIELFQTGHSTQAGIWGLAVQDLR